VIEALVAIHLRENISKPQPDWIEFGLAETRSPEQLIEVANRFRSEAQTLQAIRPLLALALSADLSALRDALDREIRVEQEKDRTYWEPLKREMEAFRRAERS